MTNSRRKGKLGELEAAAAMRDHLGVDARRGRQFSGGADSPDVRHSIPGVHVEVKRCEALRLREAVAQAEEEAGPCLLPLLLHRWNNGPWLAILRLEDVPRFCAAMGEVPRA